MTIEEYLIDYLGTQLGPVGSTPGIPVSGCVPHAMPDVFVTVEKTGGSESDLIPEAQIHVQCWHTTRAAAAALCERVNALMLAAVSSPAVSRCALSASYNNPDLATNRPCYSSSFLVTYMF